MVRAYAWIPSSVPSDNETLDPDPLRLFQAPTPWHQEDTLMEFVSLNPFDTHD